MSTTGTVDYSVGRTVQTGYELQNYVESLRSYINIEAIPVRNGWSKMEYIYDSPKILDNIREEFKKEFNGSRERLDIVDKLIMPSKPPQTQPETQYFLAQAVELVVFQSGWSYLGNDYIVLIPVVMSSDSIEATLEERTTYRRTTFTIAQSSEIIIAGGCSLWIPDNSKVVCVFLGVGVGKDE